MGNNMKPKLLDLFCGAGGTSMGYYRAGFEYIVGVDNKPQPHYPFNFIQWDAIDLIRQLAETGKAYTGDNSKNNPLNSTLVWHINDFDVYHASPPCQRFSCMKTKWNSGSPPDLLTPTLEAFNKWRFEGIPWVVENVVGAPLPTHIQLCGSIFGLGSNGYQLRRHRWFQSNILIPTPPCNHKGKAISIVGGVKINRLKTRAPFEWGKEAMGIDWMDWEEMSEAIPPAYTEYIGKYLMDAIRHRDK